MRELTQLRRGSFSTSTMASLQEYRERGTFDVAALRAFLDGQDVVTLKYQIWDTLGKDPLFASPSHDLTADQLEELTYKRLKRITEYAFGFEASPEAGLAFMFLASYDISLTLSYGLNVGLFAGTIDSSGNRYLQMYSKAARELEINGCFALTEMGHGSNVKGIKTTATYDPKTQEFVLHTHSLEHMKCWIGNLGHIATHAVVFAQLLTPPDSQCHGVKAFVAPIRDPMTMRPYSGVLVGYMGKKIGTNGFGNGFLAFDHYRIPRENMLGTKGKFTSDGQHVTHQKAPQKDQGGAHGTLSRERVGTVIISTILLRSAISIAIRYSAVRKQFGPSPDVELPVIEYQMQQWRLFPYLSAAYAFSHLSGVMFMTMAQFTMDEIVSPGSHKTMEQNRELHALSCACKAVTGFTAQSGLQESREACGGHGYLTVNQLGKLRNDHDGQLTFGGDNNVILIQALNYLLSWFRVKKEGRPISSPLGSVNCLENSREILGHRFPSHKISTLLTHNDAVEGYDWLLCYLWMQTKHKVDRELSSGKSEFHAKSDSMVFYGRSLALVYGERFIVTQFQEFVANLPEESGLTPVCSKLCSLYSLWSLQKHERTLYQGGYFSKECHGKLLHDSILSLCSELKDETVSLVDVIAPPDHILQSPIGHSNGQVYKNLFQAMVTSPQAMERPSWWREIAEKPVPGSRHHLIAPPQSKL